jgi:hypothetical protein
VKGQFKFNGSNAFPGLIRALAIFLLALGIRKLIEISSAKKVLPFTPLERPAIYGGDNMDKISSPYRKGGVKAPFFLTGFTLLILMFPRPAMAVRPFITDDARVVGDDQWQLETSLRVDRYKFQNLNLFAYGMTENFEVTLGFLDGYHRVKPDKGLSAAGPLLQGKYLFLESKPKSYPGIAVAFGATPPTGVGGFKPENWSEFLFLCLTETMLDRERWIIHANLGWAVENQPYHLLKSTFTWGIGTQIKILEGRSNPDNTGICFVGELLSGDPYSSVQTRGGIFQAGFRFILHDNIQLDATIASGLWGNPKPGAWGGFGFRMVFGSLTGRKILRENM